MLQSHQLSMDRERWQQIERLYHATLEQTSERRVAFLEQATSDAELRREVQSLLQQPASGILDRPLEHTVDDPPWQRPGDCRLTAGERLGPYEIVAGGMGAVYRVRDTRLNRAVAIKISTVRFSGRFEREGQAIAICDIDFCQATAPKGTLIVRSWNLRL